MNGVTGRMGTNQHLLRSVDAIIKQGGVKISPTECIMPDPILNGVTGRMGTNQHLLRSVDAIIKQSKSARRNASCPTRSSSAATKPNSKTDREDQRRNTRPTSTA